MRPEDLGQTRQFPLFRNMPQANFAALMQAAYAQRFSSRLELIQQDKRADLLHVVVEGSVELSAQLHGRTTTIAVVRPVGPSSWPLA
jgi:CRP/FNR family transcriptional regulator, transcriptional activator FtrB